MASIGELEEFDTSVPHSARIWNYWLGGKDNFQADREAGDEIAEIHPDIVAMARQDRLFLGRAVRYLAGEAGVRQFLDIGTGLPTVDNTHEVAQQAAPESKIVYVDNDLIVLAHARALLTSTGSGATAYIDADMRDTGRILAQAGETLDLSRPVAVMLVASLLHVTDDDEAAGIVSTLLAPLASGSYLVLVHDTADMHGQPVIDAMESFMASGGPPLCARSRAQIERYLDGLEIIEPGIVSTSRWRPDGSVPVDQIEEVAQYAVVARKP